MTKEGLEKEATEFEENYTVYEVAKRKDGTDYTKRVCNVTVKEAYLAGAEPREKRIAELEQKLEQAENDLSDYQFNYPAIKELQKENAELKEKVSFLEDNLRVARKDREDLQLDVAKGLKEFVKDYPATSLRYLADEKYVEQLIKAREIITALLNVFVYDLVDDEMDTGDIDTKIKAEQFLKEIDK